MSQNDVGALGDPTSGTQQATKITDWRDALHSTHKGATRPSYAQAGLPWLKEVSSTAWELRLYDGDTDILIGTLNPTANTWTPSVAAGAIVTAMIAAQAVTGAQFMRGPAGEVWTGAGAGTDAGYAAPATSTNRVAKAGDTMTGDLVMSGANTDVILAGTTAAATQLKLAGGSDFGGLFAHAVDQSSVLGGGNGLSDITFNIVNGVLVVVRTRALFQEPSAGGSGGDGGG